MTTGDYKKLLEGMLEVGAYAKTNENLDRVRQAVDVNVYDTPDNLVEAAVANAIIAVCDDLDSEEHAKTHDGAR